MADIPAESKKAFPSDQVYFHGFERSSQFESLFHRLKYLERWYEIACRPSQEDCHLDDIDMLILPIDDLKMLQQRCLQVRQQMNNVLPSIEIVEKWDEALTVRPSRIEGAGDGLFYTGERELPKAEIICYYTGHLHNHTSSKLLQDKSYLMMLLEGGLFVDPQPCPAIKARYINDPLNDDEVNCFFKPQQYRAAVITTRAIQPGDEIFVSYGDIYWSQQKISGRSFLAT